MSSPWLVAYGNLLLILQYVYSFPCIQEVPGLFPEKDDPCRELASKVLLPPNLSPLNVFLGKRQTMHVSISL